MDLQLPVGYVSYNWGTCEEAFTFITYELSVLIRFELSFKYLLDHYGSPIIFTCKSMTFGTLRNNHVKFDAILGTCTASIHETLRGHSSSIIVKGESSALTKREPHFIIVSQAHSGAFGILNY